MYPLYHGSKSGIVGAIAPKSREECDFGRGFYMGTDKNQPLTLICTYDNPKLYTLKLDTEGLNIFEPKFGLEWAMLIAYNRKKMEHIKGTPLYEKYRQMILPYDLVVGYIADDRMFLVLDRFFSGEITDVACVKSLSALKLGKQYVARTQKACNHIQIVKQETVSESQRLALIQMNKNYRKTGVQMAETICKQYRREGRFFDEILEAGG